VFWHLHRAAFRVTGGRFGLSRPTTDVRFGMLRLTTTGRRTGRTRVAIVGYIEDGANLVTLAMNGWGETEPAWWLNLQASPDTEVQLPDGTRPVRARAATGEERERLWATIHSYSGWGDDLDELAGRRPNETAVVVLEPRDGDPGEVRPVAQTTTTSDHGEEPRARAARLRAPRLRAPRLRPRHLWLVPGLVVAIAADRVSGTHGLGLAPVLLFAIAPHVPAFVGFGRPFGGRRLQSILVTTFNLLHHPAPPMILAVAGLAGLLSPLWLVAALAWLGHIVIDGALGDGFRMPDGRPGSGSIFDRLRMRTATAARSVGGFA